MVANHTLEIKSNRNLATRRLLQTQFAPRPQRQNGGAAQVSGAVKSKRIRIIIADSEGIFRLGLKKLFSVEDDLRVVGQAETAAEMVHLVTRFKPDLLFVQKEILGREVVDLIGATRRESPATKVVCTASALSEEEAVVLVKAGASGVILKSTDPALFVKCARKVNDHEVWLPKKHVARLVSETHKRPADTLTKREKAVISHLIQGWRNREIAERLRITEQTVKNHLRSVYDKVGVSDRLELALYAIHQRLELPSPAEVETRQRG